MKKKTNKQYAQILFEAVKNTKGHHTEEIIKNFVSLLVKERKLKQAEKIIEEFESYYKKQAGIEEITVVTARPIDDKVLNEIKKVFGHKVEAQVETDPSILGGVIIKTHDKILDGSLRAQIKNLKNKLA